ncbi:MAG: nucleotidyltransferase domain-containing protein [Bacteroidota bacterium]
MINNIVLQRLKEREKELNTLYKLDELLSVQDLTHDQLFTGLIGILPAGWQFSTICEIRVLFEGKKWESEDFRETDWIQKADIVIDNNISGEICVSYLQLIREFNGNQFLPEEQKLLNTITERVSNYIFQQRLRNSLKALNISKQSGNNDENGNGNNEVLSQTGSDQHWKWRFRMAERISQLMDFPRFSIKAVYLIGSVKNATAGPASDLDLLIHHQADAQQLHCLKSWLDGWSLCLAEENYQKTGHQTNGLIDLHLITDEDLESGTSYAVMIGAVTDPAKLLR